ncbi:MAG: hypothetical protein PVJ60_04550, partial [Phycisphaerales bacterium]
MRTRKYSFVKFFAAALIYIAFALYLYQPYLKNFNRWQWLLIVNASLGSLGCYVLSRRWVVGFGESLFAGAIYGFGPFMLGLMKFHPTAGFLTASIPWLFCPAAFGPRYKWRWIRIPLVVLPFLAIVLFFRVSVYYRLFAVSTQAKLDSADLPSLLAPLVMVTRKSNLIGFYHIPIATLIMGFCMMLAARRLGVILIMASGTALGCFNFFPEVSPIIFLSIPVLCCSVLIGEGMQGLSSAGHADSKWLVLDVMIISALSIVTLLLATKYFQVFLGLAAGYARLFTKAGKMYLLGAIAVAVIYF